MSKTAHISHFKSVETRKLSLEIIESLALYLALSVLVYRNFIDFSQPMQMAVLINSAVAALGCFVLSRRWIGAIAASLVAGAIYGFSPFSLGFAAYHPLAGASFAAIPWLFCPAAYWPQRERFGVEFHPRFDGPRARKVIGAGLSALPFLIIAGFFMLCAMPAIGPFFPLPIQQNLRPESLLHLAIGSEIPIQKFVFSVGHVSLTMAVMGVTICVLGKKFAGLIVAGIALALSMSGPLLQTSPIVWGAIPILLLSILAGLGVEVLAWAGRGDRKLVLICAIVPTVICVITFAAGYRLPATMHLLAAITLGCIYCMERADLRWHGLRWAMLCTAVAIDIAITSKILLGPIF